MMEKIKQNYFIKVLCFIFLLSVFFLISSNKSNNDPRLNYKYTYYAIPISISNTVGDHYSYTQYDNIRKNIKNESHGLIRSELNKLINLSFTQQPTGPHAAAVPGAEDIGLVDFVTYSFFLFGNDKDSILKFYLLIFITSFLIFFFQFKNKNEFYLFSISYLATLILFNENFIWPHPSVPTERFTDNRNFSLLGIIPYMHLCFYLFFRVKNKIKNIVFLAFQIITLNFIIFCRSSILLEATIILSLIIILVLLRYFKSNQNYSNFIKNFDNSFKVNLTILLLFCLILMPNINKIFLDHAYPSEFTGERHPTIVMLRAGLMFDNPKEECGVVGITTNTDASRLAFFALHAIQHRGQESAGLATYNGKINVKTGMGLISQALDEQDIESLEGTYSIGHTRYSTTGSTKIENAQPIRCLVESEEIALSHNGNVINAKSIRQELIDWGCEFKSSSDSEVILQLLANAPGKDWKDKINYMMNKLQGAYSLTVLTKDGVIGIRDPLGVRPLCLGKIEDGYVLASESCAIDHIGGEFIRELEPGEAVFINRDEAKTIFKKENKKLAACVFEYIYFARPDSILDEQLVYLTRKKMGAQLAIEHPVDADIVIGVPDSAIAAAVGYAEESGIPFTEGLVKNRYVGRTFILPDQRLREVGVRRKLNPLKEIIKNKSVIVVDDSIVRGTTTPFVVDLLRKAGAKEIHLRICAPPIKWPCHFGVDMATKSELLAANKSIDQIQNYIKADSLGYLSVEGLMKTVPKPSNQYCDACFTGKYPIPVQLEMSKFNLE